MVAEHSRVVREAVPAGLCVVDLDRFKSVNDRFGHGVGVPPRLTLRLETG